MKTAGAANPFANMPYVGSAPIVESGSNANGSYIKFADGTMICQTTLESVASNTRSYPLNGQTVYQNTRIWTFPVAFVAAPVVPTPGTHQNTTDAFVAVNVSTSATESTITANSYISFTGYGLMSTMCIAFGRWKA